MRSSIVGATQGMRRSVADGTRERRELRFERRQFERIDADQAKLDEWRPPRPHVPHGDWYERTLERLRRGP